MCQGFCDRVCADAAVSVVSPMTALSYISSSVFAGVAMWWRRLCGSEMSFWCVAVACRCMVWLWLCLPHTAATTRNGMPPVVVSVHGTGVGLGFSAADCAAVSCYSLAGTALVTAHHHRPSYMKRAAVGPRQSPRIACCRIAWQLHHHHT
jgi:hypothetical protein